MTTRHRVSCALAAISALSCAKSEAPPRAAPIELAGAGATFPYPLYRAWFSKYGETNGVRFNYFSVGSVEGQRFLERGDVDFGASDLRELSARRDSSACAPIRVPMVRGAIAVAYNLPAGSGGPIVLNPLSLARIFSGRVRHWDDDVLRALNPGVALPHVPIVVVHRGKGSGTSVTFTDYLRTSDAWTGAAAAGVEGAWPVGVAAEGNEGVASEVKATSGGIGYVEITYAALNRLGTASLRDANGLARAPADPDYPLVATTWIVLDLAHTSAVKRAALVDFVRWAHHDGAPLAKELGYRPLTADTIARYDSLLAAVATRECAPRRPEARTP